MVAHQVGKAMEEAACGSKRTNAASRVVKPTNGNYKHTSPAPRAQDGSVLMVQNFSTEWRATGHHSDFRVELSSRIKVVMSFRVL